MLNLNFTPFPNLTTERLALRHLNLNDANDISVLRSDSRVNEFIDRPGSTTIEGHCNGFPAARSGGYSH